jgi:hypothetical protein
MFERGRFASPGERPDATDLARARDAAARVRDLVDAH